YAYYQLGDYVQAASCFQEAVRLFGQFGDRWGRAWALAHLGDARFAVGSPMMARQAWQQALAVLEDLRHPDAEPVRAKLRQLDAGEVPAVPQPSRLASPGRFTAAPAGLIARPTGSGRGVGARLLRRDAAAGHHLQQRGNGHGVDQAHDEGDVLAPHALE